MNFLPLLKENESMNHLPISTSSSWTTTISKTTLFIFFVTVIIFVYPFDPALSATDNDASSLDGLPILADQKEKLEQDMFILVGLQDAGDITQEEFTTGQDLYAKARTARDNWIATLQKLIQEKQDPALSEEYQHSLQEAGETSEEFLEYVHEKIPGNTRGEVAKRTRNILNELQRSARALWAAAIGSPSQTVNEELEKQTLATTARIEAQSKIRSSP